MVSGHAFTVLTSSEILVKPNPARITSQDKSSSSCLYIGLSLVFLFLC